MKMIRLLLAFVFAVFLLNACKKSDPEPVAPTNLVYNGDMESYPWRDWGFNFGYNQTGNPNGYTNEYAVEAASSPTHSIKIKCNAVKNDTAFCYIGQSFLGATIPVGAKLTLKAKIKTVNIQGTGISIAIRGDSKVNDQTKTTFFTTTQGKTPITGTSDFTEYAATLDSFPASTDYVYIFLLYLPKTTGTAYFDDVSLTVN